MDHIAWQGLLIEFLVFLCLACLCVILVKIYARNKIKNFEQNAKSQTNNPNKED